MGLDQEVTPEQRKLISKVMMKSRMGNGLLVVKSFSLLFFANLLCFAFGNYMLKDSDPSSQVGFHMVSVFTNAIFAAVYFSGQMKIRSDIVTQDIKDILKNKED